MTPEIGERKRNASIFQESYPRLNVLLDDECSPFPFEYILHTSTCLLSLNSYHIPERGEEWDTNYLKH
jgi:hypothetical protein